MIAAFYILPYPPSQNRSVRTAASLWWPCVADADITVYFHPVVSFFFFLFFPRLISAVADWIGRYRQSEKKLLSSNPTCPCNMVNFGPLAAEICWWVWGTPANFNGLPVLLHGTVVVGVSQTLRRWTEGATCIRQGGHHVGHWLHGPHILVLSIFCLLFSSPKLSRRRMDVCHTSTHGAALVRI